MFFLYKTLICNKHYQCMINLFNIKRNFKFPFIHISKDNFFAIFCISLLLGIFGWFFETTVEIFFNQVLSDRGFLYGPFIPIYFVFSFLSLLFINIPKKTFKNFIKFFFIYAILVTALEYVVGNLIELITGAVLWNYDHFPISYEYISLPVSIIWGIGCCVFVIYIVPYLYKIYLNLSYFIKAFIGSSFIILLSSDLTLTILDMIRYGKYRRKYYYYVNSKLMTISLCCEVIFTLITIILYLLIKKSNVSRTYIALIFPFIYIIPIIYTIIYLINR